MFGGLLLALIVGLLLTGLIAAGFGGYRAWSSLIAFFLLIFFAAWAGGIWLTAGPLWWDFYWLPAVIIGLIVAVAFLWTAPPPRTPSDLPAPDLTETEEEAAEAVGEVALTFLGVTVWIWVFLLLLAVIIGYLV